MNRSAVLCLAVAALVATSVPAAGGSLQTWDKLIDKGAVRFKVLDKFAGAAVLDKETGLVWERAPSSNLADWALSLTSCVGAAIGGRRGWRLPTVWELMTLSDPSQDNPSLTAGHPFQNISTDDNYWTSTVDPADPAGAFRERFGVGTGGVISASKATTARRWCVRGPGGQYGAQE